MSRPSRAPLLTTHQDFDFLNGHQPASGMNKEPRFTFLVAIAFTLNYIVGTGFLTLPWAFSRAGCFLSVLALSGVLYFSIASSLFLLEAMARAETIHSIKDHDNAALLQDDHVMNSSKPNLIGNKKFEVTELCSIFLGSYGKRMYTFCITIYLYCTLLAYSTVFANAFASHFNIGEASYHIYLTLFACMVIPLSCMELSEQILIQVTLTFGRFLMFFFMIITVSYAFLFQNTPFQNISPLHGNFEDFHIDQLYIVLPVIVYANIFHHSIPALSHPVENKLLLGNIYTTSIMICFISYLVLGVVVSLYFGGNTPPSSNLLWVHYMGINGKPSLLGSMIGMFVVIFPAFGTNLTLIFST